MGLSLNIGSGDRPMKVINGHKCINIDIRDMHNHPKYKEAVFVLHCFKKKSTQGIKTPKKEVDLIHNRYKQAIELYKKLFKKGSK